MTDPRQELAVLNNVYWYQAMFRAHRLSWTLDDLLWSSQEAPPPFHSNLVILSPAVDLLRAKGYLETLERTLPPASFSIKDSFSNLGLAASGYGVLFDASWIWREPLGTQETRGSGNWTTLASAEELEVWEDAWWGDARNTLTMPATRQFPASLLESPHHKFFARWDGKAVVAGAIANRSPGAVGLSNTFSLGAPLFNQWTELVQSVGDHFPGVPMVGYERGRALEVAMSAGFVSTGTLRVWQRTESSRGPARAGDA